MQILFTAFACLGSSIVTLLIYMYAEKKKRNPLTNDEFKPECENCFSDGAQYLGGRLIIQALEKDDMFFSKADIITMVNRSVVIAERGRFVLTPDDKLIFSPLNTFPDGYLLFN